MIGYYVHHQGRGHLHRASAFAQAWYGDCDEVVVGLSSLAAPTGWTGPWVELPRDDTDPSAREVTARGALHWAPLGDPGLAGRMAAVSRWIETERPRAIVVDVSVEVLLLARLHGVPTVCLVQPGRRDDAPHQLAYRAADALVCPWPAEAENHASMLPGLPQDVSGRAVRVGAVSRFPVRDRGRRPSSGSTLHVVALDGTGGRQALGEILDSHDSHDGLRGGGVTWTILGPGAGWLDDPSEALAGADVVVTHAGGGALADVSAARVPAVVVPGDRPHEEQRVAAAALEAGPWPVVVRHDVAGALDPAALREAAALDPGPWARWNDGRAAQRMGDVVRSVALDATSGAK